MTSNSTSSATASNADSEGSSNSGGVATRYEKSKACFQFPRRTRLLPAAVVSYISMLPRHSKEYSQTIMEIKKNIDNSHSMSINCV
jgi:hypothetical protein